jgi:hypothetical protein
METWCDIMDKGGTTDVIYMDFAKAFDTVPHKRLLGKLQSYGINNQILPWTEAFLSGRKQRVRIGGEFSGWKTVTSGIPQGSVLGPLLFVIYINDLPENVHTHVYMFADDTKLFSEISSAADVDNLQQDLTALHTWSERWLLRFHPDKCKVLTIGKRRHEHTYVLNHADLEAVDDMKDLGVIIDADLKFRSHIQEKVNKANAIMGSIRRTFTHMDNEIFKLLFTAHVRPHLEYGNQIWYPNLKT